MIRPRRFVVSFVAAFAALVVAGGDARSESAKPGSPSEASKPEASKPEASKPEASKSEASKPERRLAFRKEWSPFHPFEYGATATLGALNLWLELGVPYPREPVWRGPILFDSAVRDLRLEDDGQRNTISVFSDVTALLPQIQALVFDSLVVPGLDGSWETALQMELFNAEAYAITNVLSRGIFKIVPRERPVVEDCRANPDIPRCRAGQYASFPSGHTAYAMVAAGLSCSHHLHANLYGNRTADVTACIAGAAIGFSTGVFRILDDRHWASDVLLGALVGSTVGYLVPTLHYRGVIPGAVAHAGGVAVAFAPMANATSLGATALARF